MPQGTVLGPILFLLFINDIELALSHCKVRCFADDSRLLKSIDTAYDASLLQEDLENIIKWANLNNMSLNKEKFEFLQYHPSTPNYNALKQLPFSNVLYYAGDVEIDATDHVIDLGITLQNDLSFDIHIHDIVKQARNKLSWILSVFRSRSKLVILTLFASLVRPILEYCCIIWNPHKLCDISHLEGVQRTATSRIGCVQEKNYWERLRELNLFSLQRQRERFTRNTAFSSTRCFRPGVFVHFFFSKKSKKIPTQRLNLTLKMSR